MKPIKNNDPLNFRLLKAFAILGGMLFGVAAANAAVPATFLEQSSSITGASDTLKISRLPVRPATGPIQYYDVEFKLQVDATGAPVLAPSSPVIGLSPSLLSAAFKAGKYKDPSGNVYTVTGPGAAAGGRTNWTLLLTKKGTACPTCTFDANWTTGPILGHPLEVKIKAQAITVSAYSYGTVQNAGSGGYLYYCSYYNRIVGYVQVGNNLVLHGFCNGNNVESGQVTLSYCTATNPCP